MAELALSIRQPWASLLVHGLKTIEIRSWPTARQGRILIHAAKLADKSKRAWSLLPEELREEARLTGGIIGAGLLTNCIAYRSIEAFAADEAKHLNDPTWFRPPVLYGFRFEQLTVLPFRPCVGWVRFFQASPEPPRHRQRLKKGKT